MLIELEFAKPVSWIVYFENFHYILISLTLDIEFLGEKIRKEVIY